MGWLADILQGIEKVPLTGVLRERVALAEEKYNALFKENTDLKQQIRDLEKENATLRAQLPDKKGTAPSEDDIRVLVYLFKTETARNTPDVDSIAMALQMQRAVVKYHLDCLRKADLAIDAGFDSVAGREFWVITSDGRRYVVETKLF